MELVTKSKAANLLGVATDTGGLVLDAVGLILQEINNKEEQARNDDQRASLVVKCAEDIFDAVSKTGGPKRGIVVVRSNLDYDIEFAEGGRLGSAEIAGWGYTIYSIYWGWIRNNDPNGRGFHNWCVIGYNRQNDNIINIDQQSDGKSVVRSPLCRLG